MKMNGQYVRTDFVRTVTDSYETINLKDGSIFRVNYNIIECYSHFRGRKYLRDESSTEVVHCGTALQAFKRLHQNKLLYIKQLKMFVCLACKTSIYCNYDKSYLKFRCDRCGRAQM